MAKAKRFMYEFPRVGVYRQKSTGRLVTVHTPGARVSGSYQDFPARDAVCLGEIGPDGQIMQGPTVAAENEDSNT